MKKILATVFVCILAITPIFTVLAEDDGLSDKQRNSISMLNHLMVLTQEINDSDNSRLFLEDAYSSLISNTYPNAVDSRTQGQLNGLLDTLEKCRMISVKRDRLQYIYEQNQAQALKEAIPNPIGLLSNVNSVSLPQLITSVVYMAVDSVTSYKNAMTEASLKYLQSGWELDDEAAARLHNSRKEAFNYMLDIVRDYELPGELALSEEAVKDFVNKKKITNVDQKIQFFESKQSVYEAYGDYWLVLASAYYQNGDYHKCIESVDHYISLDMHIFREDHELSKTIPLAIVSAAEVLPQDEVVSRTEEWLNIEWLNILFENTDEKDWALRYFTAQSYLDLYSKVGKEEYVQKAYEIVLNNVNYLVNEQKAKNNEYLADVKKVEIPKGANKDEENEVNELNKMLKIERETALPPVYEPFIINCDLLFELIKKLEISQTDRKRINGIIHENGEPIFLIDILDSRYWINTDAEDYSYGNDLQYQTFSTYYDGDDLEIPVFLVSDDAVITVSIDDEEGTVFDDWVITKVDRVDKDDYTSFVASFHSEKAQNYKHSLGERAHIEIIPKADLARKKYKFDMKATEIHEIPVKIPLVSSFIDGVTFEVV